MRSLKHFQSLFSKISRNFANLFKTNIIYVFSTIFQTKYARKETLNVTNSEIFSKVFEHSRECAAGQNLLQ